MEFAFNINSILSQEICVIDSKFVSSKTFQWVFSLWFGFDFWLPVGHRTQQIALCVKCDAHKSSVCCVSFAWWTKHQGGKFHLSSIDWRESTFYSDCLCVLCFAGRKTLNNYGVWSINWGFLQPRFVKTLFCRSRLVRYSFRRVSICVPRTQCMKTNKFSSGSRFTGTNHQCFQTETLGSSSVHLGGQRCKRV